MNLKFSDKSIEISISKNIKELTKSDIIDLYSKIYCIKKYEIDYGNDIEKSILYLSYKKQLYIKEYINITNLIRNGTYFDWDKYLKNFNEFKNTQNIDTNININEYLSNYEDIKQSIIIYFIFKISIDKNIIKNNKDKIKKYISELL